MQLPTDSGILDGIGNAFLSASHVWLARLVPVAQRTFAILAGIEVAISALIYGLRREALDDVAARFILKFMLLAVLLSLITSFAFWMPPFVTGFAAAGEQAIGAAGTVNPSDIIDIGVALAGKLLSALDVVGVLTNPAMAIVAALSACLVLFSYVYVAAQLVLVLVESYVVLSGGVVFLGFAAFRGTAGIAEGFLTYAVHVGVKIFLLYLMVSLGSELSRGWIDLIHAEALFGPGSPLGQVVGGAVIFALLATRIPDAGSSWIARHQRFSLSTALGGL
jgi:P-type conjugative transfer protein TrbL